MKFAKINFQKCIKKCYFIEIFEFQIKAIFKNSRISCFTRLATKSFKVLITMTIIKTECKEYLSDSIYGQNYV